MPVKTFIALTFVLFMGLLVSNPVSANFKEELKTSCFSSNAVYAVPACEQLTGYADADHAVFIQLSHLYQKQGELEAARSALEHALKLLGEDGDERAAHETAKAKSNIDEQLWLKNRPKQTNGYSRSRMTCINFSKILPEKAIDACSDYLSEFPNDEEVRAAQLVASNKLGMKDDRSYSAGGPAESIEQRQKPLAVQPKPIIKQAPTNTSAIDQQEIASIKQELSQLYALLEQERKLRPTPGTRYLEEGARRALVIGNGRYPAAIGRLKNPVNDAKDFGKKLKALGFDVEIITDSSLEDMEKTVRKVAEDTKPNDTLLFYYAGHGVAINGENYLIPTESTIAAAEDVRYKAMNLSYVLDKFNRGNAGATIVVLDACRNNPFPASRNVANSGLVQASGPSGTLVAYSTAPRQVAIDGRGRNGVYTKHLLKEIGKPNQKIEEMFKRVRIAVEEETFGAQVPWENSSLKTDFYFNYERKDS